MIKNELKIYGTQKFMEFDIPVIEGGFGENCRVVTAKTVAEIHGVRMNDIQEIINQNINEFEIGIDLLDLCDDNFKTDAVGLGLITSNRQKHCYLLSEQGYMLLVGFMKTDKAKEIRKNFRRKYFTMRQLINSDEQLKAQLLVSIYDGGQNAILASKQLSELEVKKATAPLIQKIEADKPYTEFAKHVSESSDAVDIGTFSKIVKDEKIDMGRNRLFEWLRNNKYLMKDNTPYQKYIENKYFTVIETTKKTAYGTKIFSKTLITGKGQVMLVEKLRKEFGMVA